MKKILTVLLASLALLAGCSKVETETYVDTDNATGVEIVFSDANLLTKADATVVDGTTFPADWTFGVAASHTDKDDFFDGVKETVKETEEGKDFYKIAGDTPYYWPTTGTMTFHAYAPFDTATADYDGTNLTIDDYDVADKQMDLLYATATKNISEGLSEQALQFNHTLAQIVFQFKKSTILSSTEVVITSAQLYVPATVADFSNGTWSDLKTPNTYQFIAADYTCTGDYVKQGDAILVLPQELANTTESTNNYVVKIVYKTKWLFSGWKTRTVYIDAATLATKHTGNASNWTAGHKYTYSIEVSTSEILFTSSVQNDWTADGNQIY